MSKPVKALITETYKSKFEGLTGAVVIDIRGNPGGLPIVAMGMAGWLATSEGGNLGVMKMRDTEITFTLNPRLRPYDGKVAVLIDG